MGPYRLISTAMAVLLTSFALVTSCFAADVFVYVAPDGNDSWSGHLQHPNVAQTDGPLQSLAAAQSVVRTKIVQMIAANSRSPIRVRLAPGTYALSATLSLLPQDSGTPAAPVSYEAETAGTAIISGGLLLGTKLAPQTGEMAFSAPSADNATLQGGGQLFINGRRATLARQPNVGTFWYVAKAIQLPGEAPDLAARQAFGPYTANAAWLGNISAPSLARAFLTVMHSWTDSRHRFAATPSATQILLQPRANWPFLSQGTAQRYYVENLPEALDAGGEWLREATVARYIPAADEFSSNLTAVLPQLDRLVIFTGNPNSGRWVENIRFQGIAFAHTRYLTPAGGQLDSQAAVAIPAAIEVNGARQISFTDCEISRTAGYAIWLKHQVRDTQVTNCNLYDLGAGGIKVGETSQSPTDPLATGAIIVQGNRISNTGRIFPGGVGIWIGQSFDNQVIDNRIFGTTYSGISAGWQWDLGTATSGRNRIANNLLLNIGQRTLGDIGGIYTLGPSPGTVISGNLIREVRSYGSYGVGSLGIFGDYCSSTLLIENNVVIGTDSGGYKVTNGQYNIVRGNVFAGGDAAEMDVPTKAGQEQIGFHQNLIFPKSLNPFTGFASVPDVSYSLNLVSLQFATGAVNLEPCGSGCSVIGATLAYSSSPKDVSITGVAADVSARIAATVGSAGGVDPAAPPPSTIPPPIVEVPPPVSADVPTLVIDEDFTTYADGVKPPGFYYYPVGDTAGTGVASVTGAPPGGKCLMVRDSTSYAHGYDPHFYAALNHTFGMTTSRFSIKIDAASRFRHEWRDGSSNYLIGPSLTISAAGIEVNGQLLTTVRPGEWIALSVTSPVATPGGTWTLAVQDSAGARTFPALPFKTPGWHRLEWIGFISDATTTAQTCLAQINVRNASLAAPSNLRVIR